MLTAALMQVIEVDRMQVLILHYTISSQTVFDSLTADESGQTAYSATRYTSPVFGELATTAGDKQSIAFPV